MIVDQSSHDDHSKEEMKSFRSICTSTYSILDCFPPKISGTQNRCHRLKSPPTKNYRHFAISPKSILAVLRRLHRGKAAGPELDSLDIFIKLAGCYTRAKKRKTKCDICLEVLPTFFTIIANGDVPPNSQNCQDLMHHIFGCFVKRPH